MSPGPDAPRPPEPDVVNPPPRDWQPHLGRHHSTKHGWRPVAGVFGCPRCPDRCPDCGAHYVPQGGP